MGSAIRNPSRELSPEAKKIWRKCACARNKSAIPTTGHPMDFVFVSKVGYSGSADRMALFPVGSNQSNQILKIIIAPPTIMDGSA